MKTERPSSLPERLFEWLIKLLPTAFRERYGTEITSTLGRQHREAVTEGTRWDRLRFWSRTMTDLVRVAPSEHLRILRSDLGLGLRTMRKNLSHTVLVVGILTLGIGILTAAYALLDGVLLRPLPYLEHQKLGVLWTDVIGPGRESTPRWSAPDFLDYGRDTEVFEDVAGAVGFTVVLAGDGAGERVRSAMITHNFFPMLGVNPILGRHFTVEDQVPGTPRLAIISHDLWTGRYSADPEIVGKTIFLNGSDVTVVGVLPLEFQLLLPTESPASIGSGRSLKVWEILNFDLPNFDRQNRWMTVLGRLRSGATFLEAQAELDGFSSRLRETYPESNRRDVHFRVVPLTEDVVRRARPTIWAIAIAAILVLFITLSNAASLLLARGMTRRNELSLRRALGADQVRLVRQLLTEGALYGVSSILLGTLLASMLLNGVRPFSIPDIPRLQEVSLNPSAIGIAFAASLGLFFFVLLPVIRMTKPQGWGLTNDERSLGTQRKGARTGLVTLQAALSMILLIGAGLLVRTYWSLNRIDPGFEPNGVFTVNPSVPFFKYGDRPEEVKVFYRRLQEVAEALPGVESVGGISQLPLTGASQPLAYAFDDATARRWGSLTADRREITPGYLETVRTTLLAGRTFDDRDVVGQPYVSIVDAVLANKTWPGQDPIGKRLLVDIDSDGTEIWTEVIGVVRQVRNDDLVTPGTGQIYLPFEQHPGVNLHFAIRSEGNRAAIVERIRDEAEVFDPDIPIDQIRDMGALLSQATSETTFSLYLLGTFASVALILALAGIYGAVSYLVNGALRAYGLRMALGAKPSQIMRSVLGLGIVPVMVGLVIGLAGSFLLTGLLSNLLFGVQPYDPVTFVTAAIVLAGVALGASYLPARRAMTVSPMQVLRED